MIPAITHIRACQPLPEPSGVKLENRLGFLQHKDVFFSAQSYRAKINRFLSRTPHTPLMFVFHKPEKDSFWGRLIPPVTRDVILATPLATTNSLSSPEKAASLAQQHHKGSITGEAGNTPPETSESAVALPTIQTLQPFTSGPSGWITTRIASHTNPFAAISSKNGITAAHTAPATPMADTEHNAPEQVRLQLISGKLIAPEHFQHLEQAFNQPGLNPQNLTWVHQTPDGISVIPRSKPQQAGYKAIQHPWQNFVLGRMAQVLAPVLNLPVKNHHLTLPNGDRLSLNPTSWQDAQGKKANLYQVMRLPDGRWFKVDAVQEEQTLPFNAQKGLRQALEGYVQKLEREGNLREVSPMPTQPFSSPLNYPSATFFKRGGVFWAKKDAVASHGSSTTQ